MKGDLNQDYDLNKITRSFEIIKSITVTLIRELTELAQYRLNINLIN